MKSKEILNKTKIKIDGGVKPTDPYTLLNQDTERDLEEARLLFDRTRIEDEDNMSIESEEEDPELIEDQIKIHTWIEFLIKILNNQPLLDEEKNTIEISHGLI